MITILLFVFDIRETLKQTSSIILFSTVHTKGLSTETGLHYKKSSFQNGKLIDARCSHGYTCKKASDWFITGVTKKALGQATMKQPGRITWFDSWFSLVIYFLPAKYNF